MSFPDARHAYVAYREVYGTENAGLTWTQLTIPDDIYSVSFADSLQGYAASGLRLWKTTDGGSDWECLCSSDSTWSINSVAFVDAQTGYLACARYDDRRDRSLQFVMKTTDGGVTWQRIFQAPTESDFIDMSFICRDTGYVSLYYMSGDGAYRAKLFKTTNGRDFRSMTLPVRKPDDVGAAFVKGSQTGYVTVEDDTDGIFLLKTVDGGGDSLSFWNPLTSVPEESNKGYLMASVPDDQSLYLLSRKTSDLWAYRTDGDSWVARSQLPTQAKDGALVYDGQGLVAAKGKKGEFWSYDPDTNCWTRMPDFPSVKGLKKGACITSDAGDPLFVLKGGKTNEFWSFDRNTNQWTRRKDIPGVPVKAGACLACDNDYVYALKGGKSNEFWGFSIEGDSWLRLPDVVGAGIREGSCLATNNRTPTAQVTCLKGGTSECWTYDLDGYWKLQPGIPGKNKLKKAAQLTVDDANTYYALAGGKKRQIWATDNLMLDFTAGGKRSTTGTSGAMTSSLTANARSGQSRINCSGILTAGQVALDLGTTNWQSAAVYDISGRQVRSVTNRYRGRNGISLGGNLSPGVYLMKVQTATGIHTGKIVIAR